MQSYTYRNIRHSNYNTINIHFPNSVAPMCSIHGCYTWEATHGCYTWEATHGKLHMGSYTWEATHGCNTWEATHG